MRARHGFAVLGTGLVALGIGASLAIGNAGSVNDDINDGPQNKSFEIDFAGHSHQSATRLEHTVYVVGKAERLKPPKIYFDVSGDFVADYVFRRKRGKFEVVRFSDSRSKPAEVKRITESGLSIRFQEGAIGVPQFYYWYLAFQRDGKVLDRAPSDTWKYHDLDPGYP